VVNGIGKDVNVGEVKGAAHDDDAHSMQFMDRDNEFVRSKAHRQPTSSLKSPGL
jgi:hypothetical protein